MHQMIGNLIQSIFIYNKTLLVMNFTLMEIRYNSFVLTHSFPAIFHILELVSKYKSSISDRYIRKYYFHVVFLLILVTGCSGWTIYEHENYQGASLCLMPSDKVKCNPGFYINTQKFGALQGKCI